MNIMSWNCVTLRDTSPSTPPHIPLHHKFTTPTRPLHQHTHPYTPQHQLALYTNTISPHHNTNSPSTPTQYLHTTTPTRPLHQHNTSTPQHQLALYTNTPTPLHHSTNSPSTPTQYLHTTAPTRPLHQHNTSTPQHQLALYTNTISPSTPPHTSTPQQLNLFYNTRYSHSLNS